MKKFIILILMIIVCLTLTACNEDSGKVEIPSKIEIEITHKTPNDEDEPRLRGGSPKDYRY